MDRSCHHGLLPLGCKHPFGEPSDCCFQVSDTLQRMELGVVGIIHGLKAAKLKTLAESYFQRMYG